MLRFPAVVLLSFTALVAVASVAGAQDAGGGTRAGAAATAATTTRPPSTAALQPPATAASRAAAQSGWMSVGFSAVMRNAYNFTAHGFAPVGISYVLNLSYRVGPLPMCTDISVGTRLAFFNPSPGISAGPCWKVAPHFVINPSAGYSASPPWRDADGTWANGKRWQHSINLGIAFGFPHQSGFVVAFPVIYSYNATVEEHALVFALKLGFSLGSL